MEDLSSLAERRRNHYAISAIMKPFEVRRTIEGKIIRWPHNCQFTRILPPPDCKAIHHSNPECGCYYCVFNKLFNKAEEQNTKLVPEANDMEDMV